MSGGNVNGGKSVNLFPFQKQDVKKLRKQTSRLVGSDPGTGKTYVGIALDLENRKMATKKNGYRVRKTLIVCPKSVISVWDDHLMSLTDENVMIIDTKNRKQFIMDVLNPNLSGYFICNWDALRLMKELAGVKWFHIIADEVHRAKNRKAQATQALKKLPTVYKTGMSGTPADNKPQDLWSIINWLWPRYYTSYWRFTKAYCVSERSSEGYSKVVGLKNVEHLQEEMKPWFVRRRKEDVLLDLPDKYYTRIWVDLTPAQRKAYDQMRKTMVAWCEEYSDELERNDPIIAQAVVAQLVRLQQYADGYVVPQLDENGRQVVKKVWNKKLEQYEEKLQWSIDDPSSKLDVLMDLIRDRDGEQIVVFSQFRSVIELFEKRLLREKIPYGLLTGSVSQEDRARNVQAFQSGEIQVFAGTIAAGGVGITLTKARTIIFIDRSWSPAINLQAEDRLHRIGQKDAVEVIDLMARNTVDLGRAQKVATKWKWLQILLGDEVDLDRFAQVMKGEDNGNTIEV